MKIRTKQGVKKIDIDGKKKVVEILEMVDINPETVIVKKEGDIIPENEKVGNKADLKLISVVSGG